MLHAVLAVAAAFGVPAAAQRLPEAIPAQPPAQTLAPAPAVQLATIDPGTLYWQRFGHNMLLLPSPDGGGLLSYNFGYFDFEQPDFLTRFLRGRMLYQALAIPAEEDLAGYVDEHRSVHLQSLALTPAQAQRLDALLRQSVQPEHRDYRYDYFVANCSTRIRDALDAALDGALRRQTAGRSRGATYRMHAMRLAEGDFWLGTGIDLGLGPFTDRPLSFWDEMFIPEMMRRHLRRVEIDGRPLVALESTWFDSGEVQPPEQPRNRNATFAAVGLAVAGLLLFGVARARRSKRARRVVATSAASLHLLLGLAGAVLLFLWIGTDHVAAHRNENLLLLNPLGLVLGGFWFARLRGAGSVADTIVAVTVAGLAGLGLLAKTLPDIFVQANLHWCLLLVPIHLALLRAWLVLDRPTTALPSAPMHRPRDTIDGG